MLYKIHSGIDILENKEIFSKPEIDVVTKRSGNSLYSKYSKPTILKSKVDIVTKKSGIVGLIEAKSGLEYKKSVSKTKTQGKVLEIGPLEYVFPCSESKVLDFLVAFQDYDYSISDIATHSGIGFKTTLGVVKHLEDQQVIVNTRNVGRALMFKLNLDSSQAKSISKLALDIATRRAKESSKQ